ncbi:DNA cytosine methyltransferase [Jeotgalibaca porci]|uniref:DNA cytosine methyltransferase n=1 Tax=Jeotgalibaca porci TaxID=1868793 RepID=UPI00359F6B63
MTIRVFEAFAGVGSQRMALRNLGIDHEVVAIAEIDKFAIKSYEAIHGETNNLGDISQLGTDDIPDHDLFTYSFPCQDISVAGKGLGLNEGSDTRSGLLWECQKVIAGKKPKYLLLENVKNLVGKKHKHNFDRWIDWLEEQGYTNYWQVLNAKNYGIPQNRERVFVVSILGEHEPYEFPEPIELELRLKDILESEVDEKFYLKEVQTERLIQNSDYLQDLTNEPKINILAHRKNYRRNTQVFDPNGITETLDTGQGGGRGHYTIGVKMNRNEVKDEQDIAGTLLARDYKGFGNQDMNGVVIAASRGRNTENPSDRTVGSPTEQRLEINKQGTSNTITTVQKDNYVVEGVDVHPFSKKMEFRGYRQKEISPCLLATDYKAPKTILESQTNSFRIRKLTPKECWRLMGFSDDDFHKSEAVNSNSQLYKQAGNSIVVDVLEGIFKQLLEEQ